VSAAISRASLLSLEQYARERKEFRQRVLEHKRHRGLALGPHVTLLFEDEVTIRYQIQEMLRIEKTFEEEGIEDELRAYGPLVPDGTNLKATMLIEYEDEGERALALARLAGIEDRVFVQVGAGEARAGIADEDMERSEGGKTSAVHFLRFEFPLDEIAAFRAGAAVAIFIDHPNYAARVDPLPAGIQQALAGDFLG
jgi:hypothetical protein